MEYVLHTRWKILKDGDSNAEEKWPFQQGHIGGNETRRKQIEGRSDSGFSQQRVLPKTCQGIVVYVQFFSLG